MQRLYTYGLLGSLLLLTGGMLQCQQPPSIEQHRQALHSTNHFLVTPRWSPDGRQLMASGRYGVGLYLLDVPTQEVKMLLPSFVGLTQWVSADAIHLHVFPSAGASETILDARMDLKTHQIREIPTPAYRWIDPSNKLLHHIYWHQDGRKIAYQWFRQRLTIAQYDQIHFQRDSVWGVAVSPDGRRVAFSDGLLERSTLYVVEGNDVFDLGYGVHPHWSPDGRRLVFARPDANNYHTPATDLKTGDLRLMGADLYVASFPSRRVVALTETSHKTEMEPVFSPTGDRIAYSDWRTGQIEILFLTDLGGGR